MDFPTKVTRTDHLNHVHTKDVADQKSLDEHLAAGWSMPYEHQAFPAAVHKAGGTSMSVANQDELTAALSAGWSEKPVVEETV